MKKRKTRRGKLYHLDFIGWSTYTGPVLDRSGSQRPDLQEVTRLLAYGREHSEDTGMPTGTIARLLIDKGFGFIRDEGGIEHFFHRSSVRGAVFELLREGQRVEFTPEESQKGPRAGDVRLVEG
jgi:cold shock protein